MPTMEEIRLALGKMDKSSEKPLRESLNIINENVNPNPFSKKLFAPVKKLEISTAPVEPETKLPISGASTAALVIMSGLIFISPINIAPTFAMLLRGS